MRRRKLYSFWIDPDQATGLDTVWRAHGVRASEQIRRAIDAWLLTHGIRTQALKDRTAKLPQRLRSRR